MSRFFIQAMEFEEDRVDLSLSDFNLGALDTVKTSPWRWVTATKLHLGGNGTITTLGEHTFQVRGACGGRDRPAGCQVSGEYPKTSVHISIYNAKDTWRSIEEQILCDERGKDAFHLPYCELMTRLGFATLEQHLATFEKQRDSMELSMHEITDYFAEIRKSWDTNPAVNIRYLLRIPKIEADRLPLREPTTAIA